MRRSALPVLALAAVLVPLAARPARTSAQVPDTAAMGDEAVRLTRDYLRINTTNPPGNEVATMRFLAGILAKEGIPFDTAVSAPGRGNIWARLEGSTDAPALVLLSHMDVVPADTAYWDQPPFAAKVVNDTIYARGALDTKTLGIVELEAFLTLHRQGVPLKRDVIFMATADEEAGGSHGAGWVVENHPEAFEGAGLLLNEGGEGILSDGRKQFGIEVTQKVPLWLRLTSTGRPGHGSTPPVASAVNRLVDALYAIQAYHFEPRIVPPVERYFEGLAPSADEAWKDAYGHIAKAVANRDTLLKLQIDHPSMAALTRNTCSITTLEGSDKINVVPPRAMAELDCRLLPDQDRDAFVEQLRTIIDDPAIEVHEIMGFTPAVSPVDNALYRTITQVVKERFPDATIVPAVSTGFTDSHFFRDRGVASYGFAPFLIPEADEHGVHGNNERISVENVRRGAAMMYEIVRRVAEGG
ncbi:MAG TPA: M20/M25/M40 family metallo-hydrolase [Gemmatimonadota bacterium]|nr:M20/M25/M40 family metallo-hydrolase [Gemmatimonadota bacterium]